jgi:GntR family transcriptional regulator
MDPAPQSPSARVRRAVRYRDIATQLRSEIAGGEPAPGSVLPSEATLSKRFGTSRVTIRRALELLRDDGLLESRQGAGWFVSLDRLRQRLGPLGTIEAQLAASARVSRRQVLSFAFTTPPAWVAPLLDTDEVLEVTRRNLADDVAFARVTVWCPAEVGRHLTRAQVEEHSFYELLDVGLGGATQTIGAAAADEADAQLLGVPPGSAVLRCTRVTTGTDGTPLLVSEHVFPGHLTEFVVDLPAPASIEPTGLRLVAD